MTAAFWVLDVCGRRIASYVALTLPGATADPSVAAPTSDGNAFLDSGCVAGDSEARRTPDIIEICSHHQ
jgi:hypothetical protein